MTGVIRRIFHNSLLHRNWRLALDLDATELDRLDDPLATGSRVGIIAPVCHLDGQTEGSLQCGPGRWSEGSTSPLILTQ